MSLVLTILGDDPRSWFFASMRQVYISGSEIGVTVEYVLLNWIIYQPQGPGIGFMTKADFWLVYGKYIIPGIEWYWNWCNTSVS